MRTTPRPAINLFAALLALGTAAFSTGATAQDVKALRGKPSSDMILEALSPAAEPDAPAAAAKPVARRRGLSLGNDEPAAETASTPVAKAAVASIAAPQQKAVPRALDLDIQFQFNSDQLTNDGKDVLDQLGAALKSDKLAGAKAVVLEGHADAKGSASYNQSLSYKRAQAARNYLSGRHGIPSEKLKAVGKGSSEPADPNNPEDEVNRRVRVIVEI